MEKPILDFCCCCFDLKVGSCLYVVISLICAIIGAFIGFVGVLVNLNEISEETNTNEHSKNDENLFKSCKIKFNWLKN